MAVALLAFTVAEFTKVEPSAGSFITYVETSLGPRAGVATAVLVAVGYTVAIAGVFTMSGGAVVTYNDARRFGYMTLIDAGRANANVD